MRIPNVEYPKLDRTEADRIAGLVKEKLDLTVLRPTLFAAFGREAPIDDLRTEDPSKFEAILKSVAHVAGLMMAYHAEDLLEDKVDGLRSDLESAVQVAYNHGAEEWARDNYPSWIERLEANKRAVEERNKC